ncbi:hypothetical protein [Pararhizobium haloflavum]|uniref:hypothetical protein n=1 Tax=Pararhizobium haloflavum TaxID=2037914 RepID=UPI000C1846CD|nr:hypothetical protein [Pararhizobium haloflavum]
METVSRRFALAIAALAATLHAGVALADQVDSAARCAGMQADLAVATGALTPSAINRQIDGTLQRINQLETELRHRGCTGSVIVIRGGEGDLCRVIADQLPSLEMKLNDLFAKRQAADRLGAGADPDAIRRQISDNGCAAPGSTAQQTASYSQFRRPAGHSSIIELTPSAPQQVSVEPQQEERRKLVLTPPDATATTEPTPAEPFKHEIVDLEDRMAKRDVRVVGPQFLPDQSEAIDLRSPVPTPFL